MKKIILIAIFIVGLAAILFGAYSVERDSQVKAFGGTYLLHDDDLAPTTQVTMTLNEDQTASIVAENVSSPDTKQEFDGNWDVEFVDDLKVTITKANGQDVSTQEEITFQTDNSFLKESEYTGKLFKDGLKIDDQESVPLDQFEFNLGAGDENKTIEKLNNQLVSIGCLESSNNSKTTYSENTRKAVVRFQKDNSLSSNGLVEKTTWDAVFKPGAKCQPIPESEPTPDPEPVETPAAAEPAQAPSSNNAPGVEFAVGNVATHDANGNPVIYLSFDDGPSSPYTTQILNILSQHGARATFFMLGQQAESLPGQVRAVSSAGHYIGNHTYDHQDLATLDQAGFNGEVNRTANILTSIVPNLNGTGSTDLLRPPYGSESQDDISFARNLGYTIVLWDIDPQDWRRPGTSAIVSNILSNAHPGAIVLSHDAGGDRSQTVAAYQQIIPQLKKQGYVFWTVQQGLQ